ncbi:MAG: hypothetical protein HQL46_16330 [Gammaproteobacteria bacterium]|nr:hypothetical protein [Gammaproteobacteria bacterium]
MIIGIHGLSNKPEPEILSQGWERAILEGLDKNIQQSGHDLNFLSVYWADVLYESFDSDPDELYQPAQPGAIKIHNENWLDNFRARTQNILDNFIDKIRQWFGVNPIAKIILKNKLNDLYRYYHEAKVRETLRHRLSEQLLAYQDYHIMLVAHSMGSIVAYDVLRLLGRSHKHVTIAHFVTIGSPLGLPHVKYRIFEENDLVRTPTNVNRWTNFSDWRDIVAVDTKLADDYQENSKGVKVQDDIVLNDWKYHHKSYGYLRTPEFSAVVSEFLT